MPRLIAEVPASSANLGPGFDAFAVALDVVLTVSVGPRRHERVVASGLGADELPAGDGNLVWRAFVSGCERFGVEVPDVTLHSDNAIPLERGMGSSAAAAVAGVALARALAAAPVSDEAVVAAAADLEGHPDNAAAAVAGGVVVCVDGAVRRFVPTDGLRPVVCIPDGRQSTEAARGILPAAVPLADAAANGARAALVIAGLAGAASWDASMMTDLLHEPPRFSAMPATGRLVTALRSAGIAACLSGAGPTALAVVASGSEAVVTEIRRLAGGGWHVEPVAWHLRGVTVRAAV